MSPPQSGYSENELFRMQQEAERRVRDMQRRVRTTVETENAPALVRPPPRATPPTVSVSQKPPVYVKEKDPSEPHQRLFPFNILSNFNLSNFNLKGDTLLILLVILLISGEDNNTKLLIALVYLLL